MSASSGGRRAAGRSADWPRAVGVAVAGWVIPGLGHWLLGRRGRALFFLVAIWGTFLAGWVLSDFRAVFLKKDRIATYGQLGMGVPTLPLLAGRGRLARILQHDIYEPTGSTENLLPYYDVGTLYTCVAGLMNVVVILSAVSLALGGGLAGEAEESADV